MRRSGMREYGMREFGAIGLAILAVWLPAGATRAEPSLPRPTATYVASATYEQGQDVIPMRIAHDHGRERIEMDLDGFVQVTILRPDLGVAYLLLPEEAAFFEMPMGEVGPLAVPHSLGRYSVEQVGAGNFEGRETVRYHIAGVDDTGGTIDAEVLATDDGIYLEIEGTHSVGGTAVDFSIRRTDVHRQSLADGLFKPPSTFEPRFLDDEGGIAE